LNGDNSNNNNSFRLTGFNFILYATSKALLRISCVLFLVGFVIWMGSEPDLTVFTHRARRGLYLLTSLFIALQFLSSKSSLLEFSYQLINIEVAQSLCLMEADYEVEKDDDTNNHASTQTNDTNNDASTHTEIDLVSGAIADPQPTVTISDVTVDTASAVATSTQDDNGTSSVSQATAPRKPYSRAVLNRMGDDMFPPAWTQRIPSPERADAADNESITMVSSTVQSDRGDDQVKPRRTYTVEER
jgi:hypothetical protein